MAEPVSIAGTWKSNIGSVYEITQNKDKFTWKVAAKSQTGEGTITGDSISATWVDPQGRGGAKGKIILDGSGVEEETGFTIEHSYVRLSGLDIRNWSGTGVWISGAAFVTIENCEVHQVAYGIGAADGAHDFTLKDVRIHHFDLYGFDASPSGGSDCYNGTFENCVAHTGRDSEQNVDGFALGHGGQHGFRFIRCETYGVFDGFDISARDTVLDKCSAHDCWNGGYKLWQDGIVLRNCLGYGNKSSNVELDWDESPGAVTLSNCTFVGSGSFNVWVENAGDTLHMFNCILAGGETIGLAFEQPGVRNYRGDHNVFHCDNPDRAVVVGYEDEFSLEMMAGGEWTKYSGQDRHSLAEEDPGRRLFLDMKKRDFRLREGSPAIDHGTAENAPPDDFAGTATPAGAGIDIGAYEWIRTVPRPGRSSREKSTVAVIRQGGKTCEFSESSFSCS